MTQYEYGDTKTNFNLDLGKIIYSGLNNVNNIDDVYEFKNPRCN